MDGFDRLAPVYDLLTRLVFGKSMFRAQTFFLDQVKEGNKVLILGGGTGWLLSELLLKQPECEVWYIDSSHRMIDLAKRKCSNHSQVHFIIGTEQSIPSMEFDVIIMNFFIDLFSEEKIELITTRIKSISKPEAIWIVTDFEDQGKWWQRSMLKIMIRFFRLVCAIEANELPDLRSIFIKQNVIEIKSHGFFNDFIKAGLYSTKVA